MLTMPRDYYISNSNNNSHDGGRVVEKNKKQKTKRFTAGMILTICLGYTYFEGSNEGNSFLFSNNNEGGIMASLMSHRRMSVAVPEPSREKADKAEVSFMTKLPSFSSLFQSDGSTVNDETQNHHHQQQLRTGEDTGGRSLTKVLNEPRRTLSINLGNGDCQWTPPVGLTEETTVESTFLVGFPGSGKRMTYLLLEALTGSWAGDDWDHSGHGYHVAHMKGAYPHHESTAWFWGDKMDHTILQVRNPRWALPSYRTIRHELDYSETWKESHDRIEYVYTKRGPVEDWDAWKLNNFRQEMQIWTWFVDFWMEGGLRRRFDHTLIEVNNETLVDEHCNGDLNCKPRTVISYESMKNIATGPVELGKLANAMIDNEGLNMIDESTWNCLYHEVMQQGDKYATRFNPYRDLTDGPKRTEKTFNSSELAFMIDECEYLRDKYQEEPWDSDPVAQQLVGYMTQYISEVSAEYAIVITQEAEE